MLTHGHEDHIGADAVPAARARRHPAGRLAADAGAARLQAARAPAPGDRAPRRRRGRPDHASARSTSSSSRSTTPSPTRWRSRSAPAPGWSLHTGDFKMDQLPLDGRITDLRAFARLGEEGVDLFLIDSTNAEVPGFTTSEKDIAPVLDRVFHAQRPADHRGLLRLPRAPRPAGARRRRRPRPQGRLRRPVDGAQHGRSPATSATSPCRRASLVDAKELGRPAAGAAGADLHRFAGRAAVGAVPDRAAQPQLRAHRGGRHRRARLLADPGQRERRLPRHQRAGALGRARRAQGQRAGARQSGHASAGELLYCYNIVRPRNVLPVHGEIRHMQANAALARATGVPAERS